MADAINNTILLLATLSIIGLIILLILTILTFIAIWKIFTKAGEPGWKTLIPIYNVYTLCKIIGVNFWIWFLAIPFASGFIISLVASNSTDLSNKLQSIVSLIIEIKISYSLAKSFGKDTIFTVGLVLLPPIFLLILGNGSSEYIGPTVEN